MFYVLRSRPLPPLPRNPYPDIHQHQHEHARVTQPAPRLTPVLDVIDIGTLSLAGPFVLEEMEEGGVPRQEFFYRRAKTLAEYCHDQKRVCMQPMWESDDEL